MKYEDLVQELTCPICLCIFTDTVSLPCGHNFCRLCIIKLLVTQDEPAGYSCPCCRRKYLKCPTLEKKKMTTMALDNIVERFLVAQTDNEESRVFCSYCTESVPAVKSCLFTEKSFCNEHLTIHRRIEDCFLIEPTSPFDIYKCSTHKWTLEYYCPRCSALLCTNCSMRGHEMVSLSEACENMKKKKLINYIGELNPQKAKIQKRLQRLKEHKRNIQEEASNMRRNISKLYLNIKEQQKMSEKEALSEISRQEKQILFPICDLIKKLEIQEDELSRKMHEVEKICHITNPMRILQEMDITIGDLQVNTDKGIGCGKIMVDSKTLFEESDDRVACKRKAEHNLQNVVDDLDEILVSMTLPQSVRDFVSNIKSESGIQVLDILLNTADKYVKLSEDLETREDQQDKV